MVNNTSILYFACVFLLTTAGLGMFSISLNDFPALLSVSVSLQSHPLGGFVCLY